MDRVPFAFLDLEMTGLDPTRDRVVEICVERVVGGVTQGRVTSLVRPPDGRSGNSAIHGIADADIANAPVFAELAPRVLEAIDGAVVVAHAAAWDVAFLDAELAYLGTSSGLRHYLDSLELARRAFGFERHALDALCEALGIARTRAHRAEDDVAALRAVFGAIVRALQPASARDLWHVKVSARHARPAIVERLRAAFDAGRAVRVRYRPSGKRPIELTLRITALETSLDPPRVLGYVLADRGRRELRADRILAVDDVDSP
jgi:DNA polymerase-3 subunit epsilon